MRIQLCLPILNQILIVLWKYYSSYYNYLFFFFFGIIKDASVNIGVLLWVQSHGREATFLESLWGSGLLKQNLNSIGVIFKPLT